MSCEFWDCRTVRSRSPRRCDECRADIPPGEAHRYEAGKLEGDFYTIRTCDLCGQLHNAAWDAFDWDPDRAPGLGELRSVLADEYGVEDPAAWLAAQRAARAARVAASADAARLIDLQTAATLGWPGEVPGHG